MDNNQKTTEEKAKDALLSNPNETYALLKQLWDLYGGGRQFPASASQCLEQSVNNADCMPSFSGNKNENKNSR